MEKSRHGLLWWDLGKGRLKSIFLNGENAAAGRPTNYKPGAAGRSWKGGARKRAGGALFCQRQKNVGAKFALLRRGAPTGTRTRDPLIKSQLLYQLSYWCIPRGPRPRYSKSKNGQSADYPSCWCRHRLIFPGSFPPSIVSTDELNFCVRDGNRWNLIVISTDSSAFTHPQNQTTKCFSTKEHQER